MCWNKKFVTKIYTFSISIYKSLKYNQENILIVIVYTEFHYIFAIVIFWRIALRRFQSYFFHFLDNCWLKPSFYFATNPSYYLSGKIWWLVKHPGSKKTRESFETDWDETSFWVYTDSAFWQGFFTTNVCNTLNSFSFDSF